jgi:hypothetical protein
MLGSVLHAMGITTTGALGAIMISIIGLGNIAGKLAAGWGGKAPYQEIPACRSLYRALPALGLVQNVLPHAHRADHSKPIDQVRGGAFAAGSAKFLQFKAIPKP